jgi:urease accessory protein
MPMLTDTALEGKPLLTLLQLTDSFFPTGAFAHSFGLETYVQLELVNDPETFETFLRSTLHHGFRNGDVVAIGLTYKATGIEQIIDLDARLTAMKIARESREGSIKIGKQFLRNAAILERNEMIDKYAEGVRSGRCAGHHAIAYGLVASAAQIDLFSAVLGYLHAHIVGQVSAAVRLIPLKPTDGQRIIQAIRPELIDIARFAEGASMDDLGGFTPGLDIRSMQHERLYSRLFIS